MKTQKDTHGIVLQNNKDYLNLVVVSDFTKSEMVKASGGTDIRINGFNIGAGNEDCIDFNQGSNVIMKKGTFDAEGAKQAATIKGGFDGFHFKEAKFEGRLKKPRGFFKFITKYFTGYVVLGQYSDYNMCADLKTTNVTFTDTNFDKEYDENPVVCWYAEKPKFFNCNCTEDDVVMVPRFIVWAYFTIRKLQQRKLYGKDGRNGCCKNFVKKTTK